MKLIDKDALLAEIERLVNNYDKALDYEAALEDVRNFLDSLEVEEVDLKKEFKDFINCDNGRTMFEIAVHFFELGMAVGNKAQKGEIWQVVDNVNHPQADKNKIYCVFTKNRYILATVINHPKDEELLQWKCAEFPHHRYDMCEGDKYMQIV